MRYPSLSTNLPKQADAVKPEALMEAVAEAVETAVEASEATDKPAVVEAVVKPEADDAGAIAPPAPMDTSAGATAGAFEVAGAGAEVKDESVASGQANGAASLGLTRLFVGCVPFQFSEDDLKAYFEPVSLLRAAAIHACILLHYLSVWCTTPKCTIDFAKSFPVLGLDLNN